MNYQKLDPALNMALNEVENREEPTFEVFIHTQSISSGEATTMLKRLGIENVEGSQDIMTATLSARALSELSEQPWVKYLRLSQVLHPVERRR